MIETFIFISMVLSLVSIFFKINLGAKKKIAYCFLFLIVFFDGLRWETGTDWKTYYDGYQNLLDGFQPGFEIGFSFYSFIIRSLTDNYSLFLLITTFIIYFGIYIPILKLTNFSFTSLFFLTAHVPWYSGSLRQMLATVFFCHSLKYIHDRKLFKFVITLIFGATFHSTIVPFIFTYWVYGASFYAFLFLALIIVGSSAIISYLINFIDSIINLINPGKSIEGRIKSSVEFSNPYLGILRKFLTLLLSYFSSNNFISYEIIKVNDDEIKLKFYLFLSYFSLIFYIVGTFFIEHVSSRLDIYTGIICLSILFGLIEKNIFNKKKMYLLFFIVALLCYVNYTRLMYMDLFHPYKSIFYNTDYLRDLE